MSLILRSAGGRRRVVAAAGITDTFTAANGTNLNGRTTETGSKTWTVGNGVFDINTNKVRPTTVSGSAYATLDAGAANIDMSVDVTIGATTVDGLLFRFVDGANYWRVDLVTGTDRLHLIRSTAGAEDGSISGAVSLDVGNTYTIRVVTSGTSISAYVNGVLIASTTNSTHQTATKHGIIAGSTNTRFDNLSITV